MLVSHTIFLEESLPLIGLDFVINVQIMIPAKEWSI